MRIIGIRPDALVVQRIGKRNVDTLPIAEPTGSILATDLVVGHLEHAYGRDEHREVWPIAKGGMN